MDSAIQVVLLKLTDSIESLNNMVRQLAEEQLKDKDKIFKLEQKIDYLEIFNNKECE